MPAYQNILDVKPVVQAAPVSKPVFNAGVVSTANRGLDIFMLYKFVRRLSTPFSEWRMYKAGVIDDQGNFIQPKEQRTAEQLASYTYYDLLILNLKKLIGMVPFGNTRIATFAAALWLLRERKPKNEYSANRMAESFEKHMSTHLQEAKQFLLTEEDGGAPANNMGDGKVADKDRGLGKKKLIRRKIARI